ncbi:MAG: hypothetical protein QOE41_2223, partial [Mycobacterium sp.]|nr:hypothetical protein [Mycobacterium sp.]
TGERRDMRGPHPSEDDPIVASVQHRVQPQRNRRLIKIPQCVRLRLEVDTTGDLGPEPPELVQRHQVLGERCLRCVPEVHVPASFRYGGDGDCD